MGRQIEIELLDEDLVGAELGVSSGEDQNSSVGGWKVHIEHLHGSELVEDGSGGEAWGHRGARARSVTCRQIGRKGDEDVGLDTLFDLVIDGAQSQIVPERLERSLDLDELDMDCHN